MSLTVSLPADYAYVVAVAVPGVISLLTFQSINVSKARKAANVDYPAEYAEASVAERDIKAKKFNCAQRAHQNQLENLPVFLLSLLHTGLYYPRAAAAGGAIYLLGRVAYTIGYSTGDPAKRQRGAFAYIGFLPLLVTSMYKAISALPVFH
ncbi:hypothetical protein JCM1840_004727 [Sporobolomyces johnsonii]